MLVFRDVSLLRGGQILFSSVTFTVHAGQKVGLTGANGAGKSSLFALVRGELALEAGDIQLPAALTLAHVAQETPPDPRPALEYVLDGDHELRALEAAITREETSGGTHLGELHVRMATIDGYAAPARAARLLVGLGFVPGTETAPVASFSGGWRMRLNLARALMCRSDLLLLDEPTNHLDLDAVIWLESWLLSYPGTLLLISHDRDFLDRVVSVIAHMERGGLKLYTGNYSAFESARAVQLAGQQASFERQQREVAAMRAFVDRFRYKASKARQAQSRLKALERLELIAPAHIDSPFNFEFREPKKLPQPLLTLEDVAAGYGEKRVLDKLQLSLMPGDRLALLGANGAGKSTLIKLLAGELQPQHGAMLGAKDLAVGYFAQHQLEQLDAQASPLLHLQRLDPKAREQDLRNFLGGFNFRNDMAQREAGTLSGGERARLVLALLLYARPNLLLLDEPTNHLDLDMRHALTVALQGFAGALVVVAHDRHLLRTNTDTFLLVNDGKIAPWTGDLDDYARWLVGGRRESVADATNLTTNEMAATPDRLNDKTRRQQAALRREQLRPLTEAVRQAETLLERAQRKRREVEALLADPALYEATQQARLKSLLFDKAKLDHQVEEAETAWLTHSEALELAQSSVET
ncbi:MAG: ATP-binding cassette domain-containing protein [Gammaproteobacteria bacterium]|nr:ATP-binding cassette domain-containing protein [Gammaproteobacteria bacterium]